MDNGLSEHEVNAELFAHIHVAQPALFATAYSREETSAKAAVHNLGASALATRETN